MVFHTFLLASSPPNRFTRMCAELGTTVRDEKGRLVIDLP
jgi:hypothetical protein